MVGEDTITDGSGGDSLVALFVTDESDLDEIITQFSAKVTGGGLDSAIKVYLEAVDVDSTAFTVGDTVSFERGDHVSFFGGGGLKGNPVTGVEGKSYVGDGEIEVFVGLAAGYESLAESSGALLLVGTTSGSAGI